MTIRDIIRKDWNPNNILIITCPSYKSKAKNPRPKSRVRDVSLIVPAWKIVPHEYGETVLLTMWLESYSHLIENYYRWNVLAVNDIQFISSLERTTYSVVTYKVHDKYNINKLLRTHLKSRRSIFL